MESPLVSSSLSAQDKAILQLLADEDPSVGALVLQQLALDSAYYPTRLEGLLTGAEGVARTVLLSELERQRIGDPSQALKESCGQIYSGLDFEEFCWKMAVYEDPQARVYESKQLLDDWARRVAQELVPGAGPHEQVAALRLVLAQEEQFRGTSPEMHFEPINGALDKVIRSRQGWATTLSTVYLLVAQRIGITVELIYLPGRILARVGSCYFEPLLAGISIEHPVLEADLLQLGYKPDVKALETLPFPLLAQMMTTNLVSIYTRADDIENLLRWQTVLSWLQEVSLT